MLLIRCFTKYILELHKISRTFFTQILMNTNVKKKLILRIF